MLKRKKIVAVAKASKKNPNLLMEWNGNILRDIKSGGRRCLVGQTILERPSGY